ncbi:MAG TPA: hypothetical protein VGI81_28175 [Tepidisphaeraceae bacterium]
MTKRLSLLLCILALVALSPFAGAKNRWKNPVTYSGQYQVLVRGYWHGQGVATVTGTTVQITATVSDDDGNTGTLTTDTLPLSQNHFSGNGTVMGVPMTIEGRAEPQDQPAGNGKGNGNGNGKGNGKKSSDDAVTTSANVQASLTTSKENGGHKARIVGARDGGAAS